MKPITGVNRRRPRRRQRPYSSPLREEQSRRTRARILQGLAKTMARGVAALSIPVVARAAGVSVPTVYRHFRTKHSLVQALANEYRDKGGLVPDAVPNDLEEMLALVPGIFARTADLDATLRAAMASGLGNRARREGMPERLGVIEAALAGTTKGLSPKDSERFRDVATVLMGSATARAFKDYLGLSAAEAADRVIWTLRLLARAVQVSR